MYVCVCVYNIYVCMFYSFIKLILFIFIIIVNANFKTTHSHFKI